jgi:hypothetical protein
MRSGWITETVPTPKQHSPSIRNNTGVKKKKDVMARATRITRKTFFILKVSLFE